MKPEIIIIAIAFIALFLYALGLINAFKVAKKEDPIAVSDFNKSYWTHIITSVNSLLIVNLSTLLGLNVSLYKGSIPLQQWVALAYLGLLLVIFLFWAIGKKFDESDKMPNVIPQLSKSFFALMLAALGVILKGSITTN